MPNKDYRYIFHFGTYKLFSAWFLNLTQIFMFVHMPVVFKTVDFCFCSTMPVVNDKFYRL